MMRSNHRIVRDALKTLAPVTGEVSVNMISAFTGLANTVVQQSLTDLIAAGESIKIEAGQVKLKTTHRELTAGA